MSVHQSETAFANAAPVSFPLRRNRAERAFDLHPGLFGATIAAYAAFFVIMGFALMTPQLGIPFAIFGFSIGMAFGVPALWARLSDKQDCQYQSWHDFMAEGVNTASGHLTGGEAMAQILTVPLLIVVWAVAVAVIVASQ